MLIRKATQNDLDQIYTIYTESSIDRSRIDDVEYQAFIQKQGFLLGLENREAYEKLLQEAHLFLVAEEDSQILGYIIADHREKFYDDEYKTWFDQQAKELYYTSPKSMTIAAIAVSNKTRVKGVAMELERSLEAILKEQGFEYLFSIITLAPVTNCPTIVFHTKAGFRRIAMGRPRTLFNLTNYSGALLFKEIQ